VGLVAVSQAGAVEIEESDGVYRIVDDGEVIGTFWNPETGESDVKFVADKGDEPAILWSADRKYLAANGGPADNRTVFLYEIGDGKNWTPVAPPGLSDEQLAPLQVIKKWTGSGTEAVRWDEDGTLLLHIWAQGAGGKRASIWANLELDGAEAKVVGTSTEEPMAPADAAEALKGMPEMKAPPGDSEAAAEDDAAAAPRLAPEQIGGEHPCTGRNADGSEYEGKVVIRAKDGLLLFQWTVGETVTHGTGLIADMTVGVALENGVAIYQAVPQADGISLIGLWKTQGAEKPTEETIFVGNADTTNAEFAVRDIDGEWDFTRELPDDEPMTGGVTISGGDVVKKLEFLFPDGNMDGEGLLLGDGLAVITSDGLSVFAITADADGAEFFAGESVNADGKVLTETLKPAK
jgi:hypothetical protein